MAEVQVACLVASAFYVQNSTWLGRSQKLLWTCLTLLDASGKDVAEGKLNLPRTARPLCLSTTQRAFLARP